MKKILLLLFIFFTFINTANATATIEIKNYTQKQLKETLVSYYMKQGLGINVINDYQFIATKVYNNMLGVAVSAGIYGSKSNMYPELRYVYNFIQNGPNVIVQLTMMQVNDAGTAFQNSTYLKPSEEIKVLNQLSIDMNGYYTYGFSYIYAKKYLKIIKVNIGQPASDNGLKPGFIITAINNKNISQMDNAEIAKELSDPEKNVKLTFKENKKTNEEHNVEFKSIFIKPVEQGI